MLWNRRRSFYHIARRRARAVRRCRLRVRARERAHSQSGGRQLALQHRPQFFAIRILEHKIGMSAFPSLHFCEFLANEFVRFPADGRPLKQHPVDFCAQLVTGPIFRSGHRQIEFPPERVFERQNFDNVRPTQLCSGPRHNLRIWKFLRELHHPAQVSDIEFPRRKPNAKTSRKFFDHPLPVNGPFPAQYVVIHSRSNRPIHHDDACVDG